MRLLSTAWLLAGGLLASCGGLQEAPAAELATWTEPWTGMDFARLDPGDFEMGPADDVHLVTLTGPFYLSLHEVTQRQWRTVMGSNPSRFQPPFVEACAACPVEQVNYWQVQEFLGRLSSRTGEQFRLPSEAEWEYACRASTSTAYAFGDDLTLDLANFDADGQLEGERGRTTPVGSYPANPWGLFDLHGNVWEWTSDPLCPYPDPDSPFLDRIDPHPRCDSPWRVIRGGSFLFGADSARCDLRYTHRPRDLGPSLGFRVVREISLRPLS